jgi:hypothetical protein
MWDVATDPTSCAGGHHPDGRLPATPGPRESSQPSFGESHKNGMDANLSGGLKTPTTRRPPQSPGLATQIKALSFSRFEDAWPWMGRAAVWNGSDGWQGRRLHLQHLRFILFRLVPVCRCKVVQAPQVVRILRAQYSLPRLQHRLDAPGRSHCIRSRLFFFGITGYSAGTTTNRLIGLDKRPGRNSDIWLKNACLNP